MATPSLYRRFRPRRFSELKGQDHVVRALRDAVAGGREGQAYLFSGPRGTGKTTSARILAKVLNCERPVDGEPCCECDACLAVEHGTSYDVHELDAASNNGVDAMRDLIERASLGTPGRHKVYILDEVHMLSKPAEAALLKTLEEPPPHVVFVLATTDPQKVSETIRSRTQHLRFHLLPAETLTQHAAWVADEAGLTLDQAAIDEAVAQGGGSARDTLSALEVIANAGGETGDHLSLDEFVEAMIERDAGRALTAMAHDIANGNDARTIAEQLVRHLRNGFLALMAPELVQRSGAQVDQLAAQAQRLGAAGLVRGIEKLGLMLVELRHAPDPRVLVEVALVQLTAEPAASGDLAALMARVAKLEQQAVTNPAATASTAESRRDPVTGRAQLGSRARRAGGERSRPAAPPTTAGERASGERAPASDAQGPDTVGAAVQVAPSAVAAGATGDPVAEWMETVRPTLKGIVRALYTPVDVLGADGATVTLGAPNDTHRAKCEQYRSDIEQAWSTHTGRRVTIQVVAAGATRTGHADADDRGDHTRAPTATPPPPPAADEDIDLDDLVDAAPGSAPSTIERIAEVFPGTQLVERPD
ncbi:MAG: DNA polymerase III subunit gamma/tau [Desertimonas sp.]